MLLKPKFRWLGLVLGLAFVIVGCVLVGHAYGVFSASSYTVTVDVAEGQGSTVPSGIIVVSYGQTVYFQAIPSTGWHFDHWNYNGATLVDASFNAVITGNSIAGAYFAQGTPPPPPSYATVTITKIGQGTVSPPEGQYGATYHVGDSISLTMTVTSGWQYDRTRRNGIDWTQANPAEIANLAATENIQVVFIEDVTPPEYCDLTITVTGQGLWSISPESSIPMKYLVHSTITITATPSSGWYYASMKRNGVEVSSSNPVNIADLGATETIEVIFVNTSPPPGPQMNEVYAGIAMVAFGTIFDSALLIPRKQRIK